MSGLGIKRFFSPVPRPNAPSPSTSAPTQSSPAIKRSSEQAKKSPETKRIRVLEPSGQLKFDHLDCSDPKFGSPSKIPLVTSPSIERVRYTGPATPEPKISNANSYQTPSRSSTKPKVQKTPGSVGKISALPSTPNVGDQVRNPARNDENSNYPHLSYKFLYPPNRLDIDKRKPDDPEYDEKTLYVPDRFLDSQTPALRQWWLIKQRNMDAILFFKMGKFYELFNEDAVTGVRELGIAYMGIDEDKPAHAGFPESAFEKYSNKLIQLGYKVIRIEQTETPAMMEERCKRTGKRGKFDKVVAREVCQVTTRGTRMLGLEDKSFYSSMNQYLLAICEQIQDRDSSDQQKTRLFGICFVDVTIGKVHIGQFEDDHNLSKLNLLLAHNKPTEVLYQRNNLSQNVIQSLMRTGALMTALRPNKEFWPIKKTLLYLSSNEIFTDNSGQEHWPQALKELFDGDEIIDHICLPKPGCEKALESFGALVYYLQSLMIADQVLKCCSVEIYQTPLTTGPSKQNGRRSVSPLMVIDHVALRNLEIFENSVGTEDMTLFATVNQCQTHFGQRLLKNWLCAPLCDIPQINVRLDVVEALVKNENSSLMTEIVHILGQTPDLERMLSKIKNQCFKSESDSRAIMFDGNYHGKAKITSFLNLLSNFARIRKFIISIQTAAKKCGSSELSRLLTLTTDGGLFPDYNESLKYFENAFDHRAAKNEGRIIPAPGVDMDYDKCQENIRAIQDDLEEYLEDQKKVLKCRQLEYFGTAKNRYQIQVPEVFAKRVPDEYRIETTRKGYKRYYTSYIDENFQKLMMLEEDLKKILDGIMSTIFEQFARQMNLWTAAIECVAKLDVYQSIASFNRTLRARGVPVCRPEFIANDSEQAIIEYKEGRHPALVKNNSEFVANDLKLDETLVLLSGANMGGKSTLMRQTALLVILAQVGSYVPAAKLRLKPIDRIFSRLGASDRLIEGESTFYTELVETSAMLKYATRSSLLLLDELGRGTSTHDGTAIAYSVIKEIKDNIRCCCLFSTHYHSLTTDFKDSEGVRLAHMSCRIDSDEITMDPLEENITFLYKIVDGPALRSYGFNVAKLAKIEIPIIKAALEKSRELELRSKILEKMQTLAKSHDFNAQSADLADRVVEALKLAA